MANIPFASTGGDRMPSLKNNLSRRLKSSQVSEIYENLSGKFDSQKSGKAKMLSQDQSEKNQTSDSNFRGSSKQAPGRPRE